MNASASTGLDDAFRASYERELRHLRDGAVEFARAHPAIARRLALPAAADDAGASECEAGECADPWVERLLEGVAFLTARVQREIDAAFPRFTSHLLERLLPWHGAPLPSVALIQLEPEWDDPALLAGPVVPRGRGISTCRVAELGGPVRWRTAHPVRLWPLRCVEAGVRPSGGSDSSVMLRWRFATADGGLARRLPLDELTLYLPGATPTAFALHAWIAGHAVRLEVVDPATGALLSSRPAAAISSPGRTRGEALLPVDGLAGREGHRLLREFAACPARFLFLRLTGLREGWSRATGSEVELRAILDHDDPALSARVDLSSFALHVAPVINLFEARADRVLLEAGRDEWRVVPDRAHPDALEVVAITRVDALDASGVRVASELAPLHAPRPLLATARTDEAGPSDEPVGYVWCRSAPRATRAGGDVITDVSLSISESAPSFAQLAVTAWCCQRDVPARLPRGDAAGWHLDTDAPVRAVRCMDGPTSRVAPLPNDERAWALVAHLCGRSEPVLATPANDDATAQAASDRAAADAVRELLSLHAATATTRSALATAVREVRARACVRRLRSAGPMLFARGVAVDVTLDERVLSASSPVLVAELLARCLDGDAPPNSFVELTLRDASGRPVRTFAPWRSDDA